MTRIFKFQLRGRTTIPAGQVLKIGEQRGALYAWVLLGDGPTQEILLVPTGAEFDPDGMTFLETAVIGDDLVFHAFLVSQ